MRSRRRRLVAGLAGAALLMLVSGCESPGLIVRSVAFNADPNANNGYPVAVDLVLVRDEKLLEQLLKVPAGDWFKRKDQYLRDYPGVISVYDWEIVPDQRYRQTLPVEDAAFAGILYASYGTAGDHRLLTRAKEINLRFLDNTFFALPEAR